MVSKSQTQFHRRSRYEDILELVNDNEEALKPFPWVKEKVEELYDQAVADACVAGLDGYTARALLQASREDIAANLEGKVAPKLANKVSRSLYNCIHPELLPSPPVLRL